MRRVARDRGGCGTEGISPRHHRSGASRLLSTIIGVSFSLAFKAALAGLLGWVLTVSFVPLGESTIITPTRAAIAFAIGGVVLGGVFETRAGFRRRPSFKPFSVTTVALGLAFLAFVGWTVADHESDLERDAVLARQVFVVESYSGSTDDPDLVQTLAEFERSREELAGIWGATPEQVSHIRLLLFSDRTEFLRVTGLSPLILGITTCSDHTATISMPASPDFQALLTEGRTMSTTPRHELVHAMVCVVLGEDAFHPIPRWYHEGIAQVQQHSGFAGWPDRLMTMSWVSLDPRGLPDQETFCSGSGPADPAFYRASWAFVRWLEFAYGEEAVRQLAFEGRSSAQFDQAFTTLVGSTCADAYARWRARL